MARIRTIKPEFWTSAQVMECSPLARLLFIGMWNFSDDHGRMTLTPKTLKAQIFPADDISCEDVRRMIVELSTNDLIHIYAIDGKEFLSITGWHHQRIDRPQRSKLPDPPPDNSSNVRRMLDDGSTLKGATPNGMEGSLEDAAPSARVTVSDRETELFRRGKQVLGNNAGGIIKRLLDAKEKNTALAMAAIETASTKQDPREYIGAIVSGRGSKEDLRARGEAW